MLALFSLKLLNIPWVAIYLQLFTLNLFLAEEILLNEDKNSILDETRFKQDGNVYVLTDNTFDDFIQQYPTTLIEFYAPW